MAKKQQTKFSSGEYGSKAEQSVKFLTDSSAWQGWGRALYLTNAPDEA